MKKTIILIQILVFYFIGFSQTDYIQIKYYDEIEKAKWYLLKNNDFQAYQIYLDLDQKCELRNFTTYYESENLVKSALKYRNFDIAFKYMDILISKYGYKLSDFKSMGSFSELSSVENWDSISQLLKIKEENFVENDWILKRFQEIRNEDQLYREESKRNLKLAFQYDSIHFEELIYFTEKNGFPLNDSFKYLKNNRMEMEGILSLLMLHFSDSNKVRILDPILLENIKLGFCHPNFYTALIDKSHLTYTRKMLYGHFNNSLPKDIECFQEINTRRSKIGHCSFELNIENKNLFMNQVNPSFNDSLRPINILIIGNSLTYFYNMPLELQLMLNETGKSYNVEQIAFPGYSLESHMNNIVDFSNLNHTNLIPKKSGQLTPTEVKISEKNWDYIIIQSGTSGFLVPEFRIKVIDQNIQKIKNLSNNPNCKFILFYTWPSLKPYPKQICYPSFVIDESLPEQKFCSKKMKTLEEEKNLIIQSMDSVADKFSLIKTDHCEIYSKVLSSYSNINLYEDDIHPNCNGAYLNACIFYQIITGENKKDLKYNGTINPEVAKFLKNFN